MEMWCFIIKFTKSGGSSNIKRIAIEFSACLMDHRTLLGHFISPWGRIQVENSLKNQGTSKEYNVCIFFFYRVTCLFPSLRFFHALAGRLQIRFRNKVARIVGAIHRRINRRKMPSGTRSGRDRVGPESSTHCTRSNHWMFLMTVTGRRLFQLALNDLQRWNIAVIEIRNTRCAATRSSRFIPGRVCCKKENGRKG